MRQIVNSANALNLHSGNVLKTTASNKHDIVLLKVVTDSGNIRNKFFAGWQSYKNAFSISRVRLTRLLDQNFQNHSLCKRFSIKRLARWTIFKVRTGSMHLSQRCHFASRNRRHGCERKRKDWRLNKSSLKIWTKIPRKLWTVNLTGTITIQSILQPSKS